MIYSIFPLVISYDIYGIAFILSGIEMKFLIIGATGTIGSCLMEACRIEGLECIGTFNKKSREGLIFYDALDDNSDDILDQVDENWCVIMLSAFVSPNWVYENPILSRKLNVDAVIRIHQKIQQRGGAFIFVSSSMVFDGIKGDYVEHDKTNPLNLYGRQKQEVEQYLQSVDPNSLILRTDTIVTKSIHENCPVEKTYQTLYCGNALMANNNYFNLIDVETFARLTLKLVMKKAQGIYHLAGEKSILRSELANMIRYNSENSHRMHFDEVDYKALDFPEPRPLRCNLLNTKVSNEIDISFPDLGMVIAHKVSLLDKAIATLGMYWR